MSNVVFNILKDIRNYLALVEPEIFSWCECEQDQLNKIISLFEDSLFNYPHEKSILQKHSIKESYKIELIYDHPTEENEDSGSIERLWIFKIDGIFYKIKGFSDSWSDNQEVFWDKEVQTDKVDWL